MAWRLLLRVSLIIICLGAACTPREPAVNPRRVLGKPATALGVVIGLAGTGDGEDFGRLAIYPPGDRRTMALVNLYADIPHGADGGKRILVRVSAIRPETSLKGGRLMPSVLMSYEDVPQPVVDCAGKVRIDSENLQAGTVTGVVR